MQHQHQHHSKLLIVCKQSDIGSTDFEHKLLPYLQSSQEEVVLYVTQSELTHLKQYEVLLTYLYGLAYQAVKDPFFNFMVILEQFNKQFQHEHKSDTVINLGTHLAGGFEIAVKAQDQTLQLKQEGYTVDQFTRGANGGTFDYLHYGHKILLSISLLAVSEHLTIGLTGDALLKNKQHREFMQSYKTRMQCVVMFCHSFRPQIELNISELQDPAGPTRDGNYQVVILTEETRKSLNYINEARAELNLNSLVSYEIGMLQMHQQPKLSSSQVRQLIAEHNRLTSQEYQYVKEQWLSISSDLHYFETTIVSYYSQLQRHYHTLRHVHDLLKNMPNVNDPVIVKLAIFFHDVIYYPKLHDNEEKSQQLFSQYAMDHDLNENVNNTKSHSEDVPFLSDQNYYDLQTFMDLDMMILSTDKVTYQQYAVDIRQEYIHYEEQAYKVGRGQVLQEFLKRPRIYYRHPGEEQARTNIKNEIQSLLDQQ